ncbi:unnamed protein product [Closterium sp. NIES-53]
MAQVAATIAPVVALVMALRVTAATDAMSSPVRRFSARHPAALALAKASCARDLVAPPVPPPRPARRSPAAIPPAPVAFAPVVGVDGEQNLQLRPQLPPLLPSAAIPCLLLWGGEKGDKGGGWSLHHQTNQPSSSSLLSLPAAPVAVGEGEEGEEVAGETVPHLQLPLLSLSLPCVPLWGGVGGGAATATAKAATATPTYYTAMASLRVLVFDHEGRPIQFDTWLDDLQLYLLSDSKDNVSLFDLASRAATAPPATADSSTHSEWLTRDAAARLAIRNHLPLVECAHFGQHRKAQALYNTVVARYSSPATAALGRLLVPYLFPELSTFATVEDLVSHLCASDARYRTANPAEFLDRNPPPIYITLYFIVTHLPDSLRSDHFLTLDPTSLTIDLLEQHLLAAETSAVAVGAARGTPRSPFFEGASRLLLQVRSAAAARARVAGVVVVAAAVVEVAAGVVEGAAVEVVAAVGVVAGVGALVAVVEAVVGVAAAEAVGLMAVGLALDVSVLGVASISSTSDGARPCLPSSFGDCYRCVPPDPGIAAAALGASESGTLPGIAPSEALHTITWDSGASCCFFRDSTTLIPLSTPVLVRLDDPSGGPVVARSSTVLPCPAVPSGSLSGLHLPSFSTNLVSTAALQDAMVTTTTPRGQRVSICTCTRTGHHLATFTRRPGSSLYTLTTKPSHVAASAQVSVSGQVAASCSCRLLSHQTLLWHHGLSQPSVPRLRGMQSRLLVFGLPRSLPPLPPSPTPPCLPCVEGRQRAAPHSSSFPPMTAPLQTLHMDVWGPARGILHSFTLPDSPQQNGIAERRIGLVMEVARTSMIHAAAPHFLWPFAVQYAAHQLNLWPRVSLPETSPTLRGTRKVLQLFGFQFSSPQPTPLSTSHSLSAPPSDEFVESSGPYPELVGCLITSGMGLVLGGRGPVVLTGHADASWVDDSAMQRSSQGYTFSLGSGSMSWLSTRSSSVLSLSQAENQ